MSKIISTKKISATFLAILLIAGTIAMISPSFMPNAHAAPYGMDNYKPSFGKDKFGKNIGVKYVKCNNINVNVNGLELDINDFPPGLLGADAAETQASDLGSGIGGSSNGPSSGFDNDGFVFVCINNNNNNNNNGGTDGNDDNGNGPPSEECTAFIACFNDVPEQREQLLSALKQTETGPLILKNVPDLGNYEIGEDITTLQQLCEWLFTPNPEGDVVTTQSQIDFILDALITGPILDLPECITTAIGLEPSTP